MNLSGKVALITGGAQGIGLAYTIELLKVGVKVCVGDVAENLKEDCIKVLPADRKSDFLFVVCNVTSYSCFKGAFEKVISTFGKIDIVINNAGVFNEKLCLTAVEVNFIGVIHGIQLGFLYMDKNNCGNGGWIINTGSNAGFDLFPMGPIYSGCKHGVIGLTKSFGTDYHFEKTGVKVAAVCPGPVKTQLFDNFPQNCLDEKIGQEQNNSVEPINPEDVAKALLKIIQDDKNGALLRIDDNGSRYV